MIMGLEIGMLSKLTWILRFFKTIKNVFCENKDKNKEILLKITCVPRNEEQHYFLRVCNSSQKGAITILAVKINYYKNWWRYLKRESAKPSIMRKEYSDGVQCIFSELIQPGKEFSMRLHPTITELCKENKIVIIEVDTTLSEKTYKKRFNFKKLDASH